MPSWPTEINPSISTLLQNAQRANPAFGKQSKMEAKVKRFKSQRASATNADTTNLSEDMMGDMDPDEYRDHDQSSSFKEKLKEWKEEEERRNNGEDEEENNEEEDFAGEDSHHEDRDDEEHLENELKPWRKEGEEEQEKDSDIESCREVSGAYQDKEEYSRINTDDSIEACPDEDKADSEAESAIPETTRNRTNHQDDSASRESLGKTGETEKDPVFFEDDSSRFTSLLTYDDGFIIAEPGKEIIPSSEDDTDVPTEESSAPREEEIPESLRARYDWAFERIILPFYNPDIVRLLRKNLRKFGAGVVETCARDGIRVLIIPRDMGLDGCRNYFSGNFNDKWSGIRRGYFPGEKLVVIGEELVIRPDPRVNDLVLYFAFAFDHALGSEGFASEHSPAVVANYNSCLGGEGGRRFIDRFSSTSPVHYFAQGVEAYLSGTGQGLSPRSPGDFNTLCTREELYDNDRPLFSYLEYLFSRINKTSQEDKS